MQNPILDKKRKAIQIRVSRPFQDPIHINQINSNKFVYLKKNWFFGKSNFYILAATTFSSYFNVLMYVNGCLIDHCPRDTKKHFVCRMVCC